MPSFGTNPDKPTPRLQLGRHVLHGGRYTITTRTIPIDQHQHINQYKVTDTITGRRRWFMFRSEAENFVAGMCAIHRRRPVFEPAVP